MAKTDSVHENARFFSLPDTNSVRQFLLTIKFFSFFSFLDDHLKNTICTGFFGLFPFCFFFFCFSCGNIEKTKTKNAMFLSKTAFLTSRQFCENTILAQIDTICVFKHARKDYKTWGKQFKNWTSFNTTLGTVLTQKTPNLGPVCNSTACIYIYIYMYALWCYYLVQVWPFGGSLSGPSLLFQNTVCQKTL